MRRALVLSTLAAILVLIATVYLAGGAGAGPGPLVDRPSDYGPIPVGHFDTTIRCSTKTYDTQLRIYYPAQEHGTDTEPDTTGAPYPTVVWMPFFGGPYDILDYQGEHLASYGLVVVAFGVNWDDFPLSGSASDINDLLDFLEEQNVTSGSKLLGMVDQEAFGICGHSSGGGLSLVDGAQIGRFKAIQAFSAAIGSTTVDAIAPMFDGRPVLLQVGQEDEAYIANSRRAYQKIGEPCELVETIGGYHSGPFQDHMYVSFFLFHLSGRAEYRTFLYGDEAVAVVAEGLAHVYFKLGGDDFFPPELTASVSARYTEMDVGITFDATVRGYQRESDPDLVHGWDVDGDGVNEVTSTEGAAATYVFTSPGQYSVVYNYTLGAYTMFSAPQRVDVSNVDPVAVAGPDLEVDQDGYVTLDGGGSHDTASDNGSLLFKWTFSDGLATNVTAHADVTRQFTEVGVVEATLTVHDPHGGETWDALEVTVVNVAPTVSTGPGLNISEDTAATFDGQGTDTPSHIDDLRYRWDFGDFTGTDWMMSPEAAHAYTRSGNYTATLSVRDPEGAMGSTTTVVRVINEVPVGTIVYPVDGSSFDKEVPVEFKATGRDTPSDEVDLLFMWDFGDGTASDWLGRRDTEVFYTYTAGGVRHVTLTVKDTDGAVQTTTVTITIVNAPPEATVLRPWPSATVSEDARVDFKGAATDTPGDQADLLYEWTIEGQTYDAEAATHTFNRSGVYDCVFRATDPDGATGTVTVQVTVENVAPEATLEIDRTTIEAGESVTYTVHLLDTPSDLEDLFVTWDFGDGGTDHAANGTHPYPSAGIFLVRVTVEDDDGETAVASVSVTVTEPATGPDHPDGGNGHEDGDDGTMGTWLVIAVILVVLGIIGVILLLVHRSSREGLFKKDDG